MERKFLQAARAGSTADLMKRIAVWAFYGIGALAILYLALYAYVAFTGRDLQPGDPIHIFRKPDAPNYSWTAISADGAEQARLRRNCAGVVSAGDHAGAAAR